MSANILAVLVYGSEKLFHVGKISLSKAELLQNEVFGSKFHVKIYCIT